MKKFQEYVSFETRLLKKLQQKPKTLLELCRELKEEVTPVNSMLCHLKRCGNVTLRNDDKWHIKFESTEEVNGNI